MIEEPPLLSVKRPTRRPTAAQIALFRDLPTPVVADAMTGAGCLAANIRPLDAARPPASAAGPALTVDCGPADILALLAALKFMSPGDMVVIAFSGHQNCAVFGDRIGGMMKNLGVSGAVTDGPVRDIDGILSYGLDVWCTGLTPATPFANGPGSIGLPVQLGGQSVATGDMVVADRDGVVIVPFSRIDEVGAKAREILLLETALQSEVDAGLRIPEKVETLLKGDRVRWVE